MFGSSDRAAVSAVSATRPTVPTTLAVAAVAAVFFAIAGPAYAEDCNGGYRMLKGEIPVACEGGSQERFSATQPSAREPLYTGSIKRTDESAAAMQPSSEPAPASSNGEADCVGGMRSIYTANSGMSLMLKCS